MQKNTLSNIVFISYIGNYAITYDNTTINNYSSYKAKKTIKKSKESFTSKKLPVFYFED